jgi:hypothetical protein
MTIIRAVLLLFVAWTPLAAQAPAERTITNGIVREGRLRYKAVGCRRSVAGWRPRCARLRPKISGATAI